MTKLFQKIALLAVLFAGGMLNASCPTNYTTLTNTRVDSNGNTIFFSICFPSIVSLTVNSGQFNIYITIQNQGANVSTGVRMCSFIPFNAIFSTVSGTITSNPANGGTLSTVANICDGSGRGDFNFASGIVAGGTATATLTIQALSAGSYTYTANTIAQGDATGTISPTITVEAACPTITASNGAGATACSNSSGTGNLYNFVTGGDSPYTFSSAGNVNGTVSISSGGIYTFTPSATGVTGSFNYQAFDIAGCPSNTGTITVPIASAPIPGNDAFYVTTFGTPVVGTLNFTEGTPPFTITTNNINNGSVIYNSNTAQFTFTQTAPGASFFDYTVTDANGCTISLTPNIYIYSCNPGYTASANLFNNVIYAICAPSTVTVGNTFQITATFVNPNVTGVTPTVFALQDLVPDPTQVAPPCPCDPGLLYLSNTGVPVGTTFLSTGVNFNQGGMGSFSIDSSDLAPGGQFSLTMNVQATATGMQFYTARVPSNPNFTLTVNIDVLPCPTITGGSTGIQSCNNTVTGSLEPLVVGGSGPYSFTQTGTATCGDVGISPSGAFTYTAPIGFTGPCSFDYVATDINGCVSSTGTVTIIANLGPTATGSNVFICENTTLQASLSASGGTPPYTFSIVTNGTLGTATITDANLGTFNYVPNPDTFGNDFFTFQVADSAGCTSNIAQYNIGILETPNTAVVSLTACTNTPVSGDLTAYVTGGTPPYIFTGNGAAVGGSVIIGFTGPYTFTPNTGFTGVGGFPYSVNDASSCSSSGVVNILFSSPIAGNTAVNSCVNGSVSGNLSGLVTDGFPPYVFGLTGSPVGGSANVISDGTYFFTATNGFTGNGGFVYQVTDSQGCIGTASVGVTVSSPIAGSTAINLCTNGNTTGSLTGLVNSGFPPYIFGLTGTPAGGSATVNTDGSFNFTASSGFTGNGGFSYQVTDSNNCIGSGSVGITISQPVVSNTSAIDCGGAVVNGNLSSLVTSGFPPYTFGATGSPVGGSVTVGATGNYSFTPNTGFAGVGGFNFQVADSIGCLGTGAVDITVSSLNTLATGIGDCVNGTVNGSLTNFVTGGIVPYIYAATGGSVGGSVTINPSGAFSFVADTGFSGNGGFGYQVTDSVGCSSTGSVNVLVSSPIAGNTAVRDCVGGSVSGSLAGLVSNGFPPYVFGLTGSPVGGSANVISDGTYFFTASPGFTGSGGFVYQVTDTLGCFSTAAVEVTVSSPIAGNTAVRDCANGSVSGSLSSLVTSGFPPYTFGLTGAPVGGSVTISPSGVYNFSANPGFSGAGGFIYQVTDTNSCLSTGSVDVTVSSPIASNTAINLCYNSATAGDLSSLVTSGFPPYIFGLTGSPVGGAATVGSTGTFTFSPNTGFSGPGGFVYQVTDTNACLSTGQVAINVGNLIAESTSITICNEVLNSNLQSIVSGGVDPITFTGPLSLSCSGSSVTISPTGNFTYISPSGFTGPCNFVYQVNDALGCSSTGTVTVIANTASMVNNGVISTCSNIPVSDSLADLIVGNPPPPLTFIISTQPTNGTLTSFDATTGAYTYTPNANFSGVDSFQFFVVDSGTPVCTTNIGTVNITVNANPVVVGSLLIPCVNQSISDSLAGLVQGNPPQPLTFELVTLPQFGTITNFNPSTGAYTYTPNTGYIGLDAFNFQVTDANGCVSNVGTITVDVILCCPLSDDPIMQLILELYGGMTGAMNNAQRK